MRMRSVVVCVIVAALFLCAGMVAPTWATSSESVARQSVPTITPTDEPPPATTVAPPPATTVAPPPATTVAPPPATTVAPPPATTVAPPPGTTATRQPPGPTQPPPTVPPGTTATPTATTRAGTPPPASTVTGASVTTLDAVKVRAGPGTDFDVLGFLGTGLTVPATGKDAEPPAWWQIEYAGAPDGRGWVNAQFVEPNAEALKLPVVWGTPTPSPAPTTPAPTAVSTKTAPQAVTKAPENTAIPSPTTVVQPAAPSTATQAASATAPSKVTPTQGGTSGGSFVDVALPVGFVLVMIGLVLWRARKQA